jgi:hypothetical protein
MSDFDYEGDGDGSQSDFPDISTTNDHLAQFPDMTPQGYLVIDTKFDLNAKANKKIPYPRNQSDRKIWTDKERIYAGRADIPLDRGDFVNMVYRLPLIT